MYQWGTRSKFAENPSVWWNEFWLKTHQCDTFLSAKPNKAHFALSEIMQFVTKLLKKVKCCTGNTRTCGLLRKISIGCITRHMFQLIDTSKFMGHWKYIGVVASTDHISFTLIVCSTCPYAHGLALSNVILTKDDSGLVIPPICGMFLCECCGLKASEKCKSLLLPMALFFDERYSSHKFFNIKTATDWMVDMDAVVFVGTSMSVGITESARRFSTRPNKEAFALNLCSSQLLPQTIIGTCEISLTALASQL